MVTQTMADLLKPHSMRDNRAGPLLAAEPDHAVANALAKLAMLMPTADCYDTHGGLDAAGRLADIGKAWTVRAPYDRLLARLSERHGVERARLDILDQSVRVKKARGHRYFVYWSCAAGTYMVFLLDTGLFERQRIGNEAHTVPIVLRPSGSRATAANATARAPDNADPQSPVSTRTPTPTSPTPASAPPPQPLPVPTPLLVTRSQANKGRQRRHIRR